MAAQFQETEIEGETTICREAFMDAKLDFSDFFAQRAEYMSQSFQISEQQYAQISLTEFQKITEIPDGSCIFLWFENDLFCLINLLVCLHLIPHKNFKQIYRVFPTDKSWKGFGTATSDDLKKSFSQPVLLTEADLHFSENLLKVYAQNDTLKMSLLSDYQSFGFQNLNEVIYAAIHRNQIPTFIQERLSEGEERSEILFREFSEKFGEYGLGDLQFQKYFDAVIKKNI